MEEKITKNRVIPKGKLKAKLLETLRNVEETHEDRVITYGKPVQKLVKFKEEEKDIIEEMPGKLLFYKAPFEPVGEEDWEALK